MDTALLEDTIPGRCHLFGELNRHHRVKPTFTELKGARPVKNRQIKYGD